MADGAAPRRRGLTREVILAEALALVDAEGLDALSLRTLGTRLGVSQTAIYRHVPDKASLLDGIAERIWAEALSELDARVAADAPADWRAASRLYATVLLATLRAHPNAVVLMLTHPISTPGQFALVARSLSRLAAAGVALPVDAIDLVCALTVYTTGFAAAEVAPPAGGAADEPGAGLTEALDELTDEEREQLEVLLAPMRAGSWNLAGQFKSGLEALLAGWGRRA